VKLRVRELTLAQQRVREAWLFLAPMLIVLIVVAGWPLARTILFSLTDARLDNPSIWSFVGLSNYSYLFEDSLWWRSVVNTLVFSVISVSIETALGLIIALALNARMKGRGLLRAAVLIPWAIPTWCRPRCGAGCFTISTAS